MFGLKHASFDATTYVIHYQKGKVQQEGRGLSFFYFAPNSSIAAIPMSSNDLPFIFGSTTRDYQTISTQGQISYRVIHPEMLAAVLDFTVDARGNYKSNDVEKLNQRIINEAQTSTSTYVHQTPLKEVLRSGKVIEGRIFEGLLSSAAVSLLGVEIMGVNVLKISANPETARALETETRERLLQEADEAVYERRNFAVEQERRIKETELNTEIAVKEKQKQIAEKQMESDVMRSENQRELRELQLSADISMEDKRQALITQKVENDRKEADARKYVLEANLEPYRDIDWKTLTALKGGNSPAGDIALAFREMADNAGKIGNLNISPDLLETVLKDRPERRNSPRNER
ncbi:SPFH domain-containing protein [Neolewinella antarctica]|uniref:Band 7 domain-containing protein n=1 Tax=Neolewinella antarctica TaxID=442734 RepID=A0ABX0X7E0_9BACT|nr:SPFH domain-containing protein [Neolewinella antarctica]NJC24904.1 hypothetical protein [Neolewinella antarctica]